MAKNIYTEITPRMLELADMTKKADIIDSELFTKYDVKRGLRDVNGKGVLAGLTHISDVRASKMVDGVSVPTEGSLFYRGYNVKDLVNGFLEDGHFGFEEIAYLLLSSKLPNREELEEFEKVLADYRKLPDYFVRDMFLKAPGNNIRPLRCRCRRRCLFRLPR